MLASVFSAVRCFVFNFLAALLFQHIVPLCQRSHLAAWLFPFHNAERLEVWITNGCEDYTPTQPDEFGCRWRDEPMF